MTQFSFSPICTATNHCEISRKKIVCTLRSSVRGQLERYSERKSKNMFTTVKSNLFFEIVPKNPHPVLFQWFYPSLVRISRKLFIIDIHSCMTSSLVLESLAAGSSFSFAKDYNNKNKAKVLKIFISVRPNAFFYLKHVLCYGN